MAVELSGTTEKSSPISLKNLVYEKGNVLLHVEYNVLKNYNTH